jgi:hypothetical protein
MGSYNGMTDAHRAKLIRDGIDWAESLRVGDTFRGSHGEGRARGLGEVEVTWFGSAAQWGLSRIGDIRTDDLGVITSITVECEA